MVLPRRPPQWTALLKHRSQRPMRSSLLSRTWQHSQRRGYASGGDHSTKQASSDLPWYVPCGADTFTLLHHSHYKIALFNTNSTFDCRAVGAIAVTVPTCWYLLQPDPNKGHGHGHGEGHGDHEGEEEHEETHESTEDEPAEKDEEALVDEEKAESTGDDGNDARASDDSGSDEEKGQETPDTSDDDDEPKNVPHETDSGGDVEGVQFKGASKMVKEDDDKGDTRKHIPDAKGFNKKRIESKYGNRLGVDEEGDDKTELTDRVRNSTI